MNNEESEAKWCTAFEPVGFPLFAEALCQKLFFVNKVYLAVMALKKSQTELGWKNWKRGEGKHEECYRFLRWKGESNYLGVFVVLSHRWGLIANVFEFGGLDPTWKGP